MHAGPGSPAATHFPDPGCGNTGRESGSIPISARFGPVQAPFSPCFGPISTRFFPILRIETRQSSDAANNVGRTLLSGSCSGSAGKRIRATVVIDAPLPTGSRNRQISYAGFPRKQTAQSPRGTHTQRAWIENSAGIAHVYSCENAVPSDEFPVLFARIVPVEEL